ncbi:hypothetical protein EP7_004316 [Isosphaeraceae bacterium EP7]
MNDRVKEIKERCEKATPGPWMFDESLHVAAGFDPIFGWDGAGKTECKESDARFIAHAREDIPYLLARVAELEEFLAGANTGRTKMSDLYSAAYDRAEAVTKERDALRLACSEANDEVCQTLGKALGYPWFKDDQKNFPGADETHGVCVGEHVAETIAEAAAKRIAELEEQCSACEDVAKECIGLRREVAISRNELRDEIDVAAVRIRVLKTWQASAAALLVDMMSACDSGQLQREAQALIDSSGYRKHLETVPK